jgi:hypothetical protein
MVHYVHDSLCSRFFLQIYVVERLHIHISINKLSLFERCFLCEYSIHSYTNYYPDSVIF